MTRADAMTKTKQEHLEMNRTAWDACHRGWHEANTAADWFKQYQRGETDFDDIELELLGDIRGKDVLQLSCAGDASQAFSLAVLGANVWACDFSQVAIDIARKNAKTVGFDITFALDDSQQLATYDDNRFDLVYADYNLWYYEDLPAACRNWCRVLRPGGRLLLHEMHPMSTWCLEPEKDGRWNVRQAYGDPTPEYYKGEESGPFSHGDPELLAVEFPHRLSDILNAIFDSGLIVDRMIERTSKEARGQGQGVLPSDFFVTAQKA